VYSEHYNTLLKQIKICVSRKAWMERLVISMAVLICCPKLIYRFNTIPIRTQLVSLPKLRSWL
jgi:hypothetical protein